MVVTTSASYVIAAALGAPLLIQLGVPELAAHLFVLYFAVFAEVTPPVAVASYTAAAIAKANPMKTGLQAFRMATGGRSEEHTSELQSLMRISYAVFCLKKKKQLNQHLSYTH